MFRRSFFRFSVILAWALCVAGGSALHAQSDNSHARKYKAPPASAHIEVTVLKADNGKPIQDAHVIFHPIQGDRDKGDLELKTDDDGKTIIDVLPIGDTVRLQIIAHGFETYGGDYKVDKPRMTMEIRLKRPGAQYSIYKDSTAKTGSNNSSSPDKSSDQNSNKNSGSGNSSSGDKSPNSSPGTAPPPSDSKSSSQPDPSTNSNPPQSQ